MLGGERLCVCDEIVHCGRMVNVSSGAVDELYEPAFREHKSCVVLL